MVTHIKLVVYIPDPMHRYALAMLCCANANATKYQIRVRDHGDVYPLTNCFCTDPPSSPRSPLSYNPSLCVYTPTKRPLLERYNRYRC